MPPDLNKIMWLISVFEHPESSFFPYICPRSPDDPWRGDPMSWTPKTDDEKRAFAKLTALENRASLKAFYSIHPEINPVAEVFRKIIEKAINEELPLGKRGSARDGKNRNEIVESNSFAPKLKSGQRSVFFAETRTGIVLTPDRARYLGEGKAYVPFNTEAEATAFIYSYVQQHPSIECQIRDENGNYIRTIRSEK